MMSTLHFPSHYNDSVIILSANDTFITIINAAIKNTEFEIFVFIPNYITFLFVNVQRIRLQIHLVITSS